MIAAVNPSSNGRGGSTYAPAGRPTGVTGAFSSPGTAAGTPLGVPSSSIIEGRNNRGSNVQLPYARLVPMHARENRHATNPQDKRLVTVDGRPQLEYDGLHQGELAWILGRRFKAVAGGGPGDTGANPANGLEELGETQRYAHQAYAGLGNGVDRMQRLASTGWVQSMVEQKMKGASINLHAIDLSSGYAKVMDSGLVQYVDYLAGASPLQVPDVAWWRAQIEDETDAYAAVGFDPAVVDPNSGRRLQGINVAVTGPFLRGVQTDSKIVRFDERRVRSDLVKATVPEDMPRNLGDSLAFSALETELRRRNLMDWTPDGIVLSKLESPTDEPMKSTELDARQAQLFNIGIQGPAITTSWTSDVRDHKLEVQPMDKVFICLVATLIYRVNATGNAEYETLRTAQNAVLNSMIALKAAIQGGGDGVAERGQVDLDINAAKIASNAYITAVSAPGEAPEYQVRTAAVTAAKGRLEAAKAAGAGVAGAQTAYDAAVAAVQALWNPATKDEVAAIMTLSSRVRKNIRPSTQAILTDFRLIRTTSSHMANFSNYRPGDKNSRMGLKLGALSGPADNRSGLAEVIVGGWCVGTVIDSAATRSTIGFQTVKSHPTSMAINLNVNVQWWSGDKLYKHYMDTGGQVMMRGLKRPKFVVGGVEYDEPLPAEDKDILPRPGAPGDPPPVGEVAGDNDLDGDVPPIGEWRNVRQRTMAPGVGASAAASASTQPSAFAAAGGSRARQGSSRRA